MRDLLVAFIVFGSLPFILKRPFWGILMLAWLGYMNPHRLCYSFMLDMPAVQIVAITTLIGMLASQEVKRMVWSREIVVLLIFIAWMGVTTTQAVFFDLAMDQYVKVIKIQILTFMTLLMLTSRERVHLFIWVIVLSLGFYGVKGGIFTVLNGGAYRVQGPFGTFIGGNNELALALIMTIPLMRYLQLQEKNKLIRLGLAVGMTLTALAAVGSQSRGALVGMAAMGTIFWLKSRNRFATALLIIVAGVIVYQVMPEEWYQRMNTIETYDEDASALGRINMWWMAWNLANDRIFGGIRVLAGRDVRQLRAGPNQHTGRAQHLFSGAGRPRLGRPDLVPVVAGVDVAQVQRGDPSGAPASRCDLGARPRSHAASQHRGLCVGRRLPGAGLLRLRLPHHRTRGRRPCPADQSASGERRYL